MKNIPKQLEKLGIWLGGSPDFLSRARGSVRGHGTSSGRKIWGKANAAKNQFFKLFRYTIIASFTGLALLFTSIARADEPNAGTQVVQVSKAPPEGSHHSKSKTWQKVGIVALAVAVAVTAMLLVSHDH